MNIDIFRLSREPDPMVAGRLSIKDYKRPLRKGLVNCPYHFRPENRQILSIVNWC